jgi:hypothetical protein
MVAKGCWLLEREEVVHSLTPCIPLYDGATLKAADSAATKSTSHSIRLNSMLLVVDAAGELPPFVPIKHAAATGGGPATLALQPLTFMLAVFPDAGASAC